MQLQRAGYRDGRVRQPCGHRQAARCCTGEAQTPHRGGRARHTWHESPLRRGEGDVTAGEARPQRHGAVRRRARAVGAELVVRCGEVDGGGRAGVRGVAVVGGVWRLRVARAERAGHGPQPAHARGGRVAAVRPACRPAAVTAGSVAENRLRGYRRLRGTLVTAHEHRVRLLAVNIRDTHTAATSDSSRQCKQGPARMLQRGHGGGASKTEQRPANTTRRRPAECLDGEEAANRVQAANVPQAASIVPEARQQHWPVSRLSGACVVAGTVSVASGVWQAPGWQTECQRPVTGEEDASGCCVCVCAIRLLRDGHWHAPAVAKRDAHLLAAGGGAGAAGSAATSLMPLRTPCGSRGGAGCASRVPGVTAGLGSASRRVAGWRLLEASEDILAASLGCYQASG